MGKWHEINRREPPKPTTGIAVDASCIPCPTHKADGYFHGRCEHRAMDIATGEILISSQVYPQGTINLAEFIAIATAVKHFHEKGDHLTPIYSDSYIAINWYRDRDLRSNLPLNEFTWEIIDAADDMMKWVEANSPRNPVMKWRTRLWGDVPADYGRK